MRCLMSAVVVLGVAAVAFAEDAQVVFQSGLDGYHTYRIPGLVLTRQGTLLAFCEGRKASGSDAGDIDLLLKRSADGGMTWSAQQLVYEEGDDAP